MLSGRPLSGVCMTVLFQARQSKTDTLLITVYTPICLMHIIVYTVPSASPARKCILSDLI